MIRGVEAALDRLLSRLQGPPETPAPLHLADLAIGIVVTVLGVGVSVWGASVVGDTLYTEASLNLWFQADSPRVVANLLDPSSNQYRASVHPAFAILLTPWVSLLPALGIAPLTAAKAVIAVCGGLSAGAIWAALRGMALPRPVALLFSMLFLSSAAFLHWHSIIEIAAFNGLSVCAALAVLALGTRLPTICWVLASALSLSMTVTNWSAGLAATIARWPLRRAIVISAAALGLVMALSVAQRMVYPTAGLFFDPRVLGQENDYSALYVKQWSAGDNLRSAVIYAGVAPAPADEPDVRGPVIHVISNQHQGPATAGPVGVAAMLAWGLLLVCGVVGARCAPRQVVFGLALMIGAQLVLALAYGELTFLYAANIMPMLTLLAACAWFGPLRYPGALLAAIVVTAGGYNNVVQFTRAADLADDILRAGGNPVWDRYSAGRFVLPAPPRAAPLSPRTAP